MSKVKFFTGILRNFKSNHYIVTQNAVPKYYSTVAKTQFLSLGDDKQIAYKQLYGDNPGIIFCPGFQSTMQGVKASALEEYCRQKKLSYVRFDYEGCGDSSGDLREVTLSDWKANVLAILDQITAGPQILVGSSMGGLLMLHTALQRPHRVHALVGIATAVDFPQRGFNNYPQEVCDELKEKEYAIHHGDEHSYVLTRKLAEDLPKHNLMDRDEIEIKCPVHLLHGMQDEVVSYSQSIKLANKLWTEDVEVLFRKSGDHRFSQPDDIQLMFETLDLLIFGMKEIRDLAIDSWSSFTLFPQPAHLITKEKLLKKY